MRKKIFLHQHFLRQILSAFFSGRRIRVIHTSTVQWDLATTIAYAKQNNIQVNIVRLDEKLSEQDLLFARAAKYPNLAGSATQSLTHSGNTNPVVGGFQTQSNLAGNYGLSSAWTIYRGGYLNYDVKSKNLQLQGS
jgi:outer membrane protein